MIGDPGGKSEERNLLSVEALAANLAGIRTQLGRFLDFSDGAGDCAGAPARQQCLAREHRSRRISSATSANTSP